MDVLFLFLGMIVLGLMVVSSGGGRNLHRPNGYSPRGGGLNPRKYVVGKPLTYKHGQEVVVGSLEDYFKGKGTVKFYNAETDEFQDEKP